ncbi:uncharacterized protein LOC143289453 isoform X2 [Babylonia areolata]|uniref:uncharacterized protein LOC143289453 isoform X2 n=1 Tax=Babylonia areolata TaxID=304850 RepID=UPI003FD4C6FA
MCSTQQQWSQPCQLTQLLVLTLFLTAGVPLATASDIHMRRASFTYHPSNDNAVIEGFSLFEVPARSRIECSKKCVETEGCVMCTYYPSPQRLSGRCQLYYEQHNLTTSNWRMAEGAKTYARVCPEGYFVGCDHCLLAVDDPANYTEARNSSYSVAGGLLPMPTTYAVNTCILYYVEEMLVNEIPNGVVECQAGSVRCDPGYLYSLNDTSFTCGQQLGQCGRSIWTGQEANAVKDQGFPLPRVPSPGWTVSVTGSPTAFTSFSIDYWNKEETLVVNHMGVRMSGTYGSYQSVFINEAVLSGGSWTWGHQEDFFPRPYPFDTGKEFTVKIVATEDNSLTFYANEVKIATRTIAKSIQDISCLKIPGDVTLSYVSLRCA